MIYLSCPHLKNNIKCNKCLYFVEKVHTLVLFSLQILLSLHFNQMNTLITEVFILGRLLMLY